MAAIRSFRDYVADRFGNEFETAVGTFVETNPAELDLRLRNVRNIESIEVIDSRVKYVDVYDLPEMKIAFNVILEADLYVRDSDNH